MLTITKIKVSLLAPHRTEKCGIYAIVKLELADQWVINDLKVLNLNGWLSVTMPRRKELKKCQKCQHFTEFDHRFCPFCASTMPEGPKLSKTHSDIVHPSKAEIREQLTSEVLKVFFTEYAKAGNDARLLPPLYPTSTNRDSTSPTVPQMRTIQDLRNAEDAGIG